VLKKEFWAYEAPAPDEKGVRVWDWELPEKGSGFRVYPVFDSYTIARQFADHFYHDDSRMQHVLSSRITKIHSADLPETAKVTLNPAVLSGEQVMHEITTWRKLLDEGAE
jgi:hypothetical protein